MQDKLSRSVSSEEIIFAYLYLHDAQNHKNAHHFRHGGKTDASHALGCNKGIAMFQSRPNALRYFTYFNAQLQQHQVIN